MPEELSHKPEGAENWKIPEGDAQKPSKPETHEEKDFQETFDLFRLPGDERAKQAIEGKLKEQLKTIGPEKAIDVLTKLYSGQEEVRVGGKEGPVNAVVTPEEARTRAEKIVTRLSK